MNCHANKSIECTVQQCANHCEGENYCSLDRILVGTHEACPTVDQCTDCMSFRKKNLSLTVLADLIRASFIICCSP